MAARGERQRLTFGLIRRLGGSITSRDLAEAFGLSLSGAATDLARYQRQGLLHRERMAGPGPPVYVYSLTRTGFNKARWWAERGYLQPPEQEHLPGLEPEEPERRVIRPVVHRRRLIRPEIHHRGE